MPGFMRHLIVVALAVFGCASSHLLDAMIFDGVTALHVWITVSSLINKDTGNQKSLIFRQIELNWINAPLEYETDYIGLYLDSEPSERSLPVSVHRLSGQATGHIITDFFLPQLDFLNDTLRDMEEWKSNSPIKIGNRSASDSPATQWNSNDQHPAKFAPSSPPTTTQCLGYCLAYHSRGKILATNCLMTKPTWMQDMFQYIGTRSLPNLMIPGSHNSATYPKSLDKTALSMLSKYQMNQDEPIFNQLVYGIRHLDLRVGYSKVKQRPERYWIYHDIFRTDVSVEEVLEQVRRFLDLTSHELVIMDFHRFTVGFQNENQTTQRERHSRLVELIFKKLGSYIVPSYLGQQAPLSELVPTGKRLVVGYAARSMLLGSNELSYLGQLNADQRVNLQVQDIDAPNQEDEISASAPRNGSTVAGAKHEAKSDRRLGSTLFNKFRSHKFIGRAFSKRSLHLESSSWSAPGSLRTKNYIDDEDSNRAQIQESGSPLASTSGAGLDSQNLAKVALFFPPVRHLWPNKDTIDGLAQYMNDTTCRKYFGELRSMMVELTPTVFGAISDKYDGNRRLAQQVNRPVTDWIRDKWLHCINIVASDYFLGNDMINLAIYANKMRAYQNRHAHSLSDGSARCRSFRKIGHLLDKSKIPVQFTFHETMQAGIGDESSNNIFARPPVENGIRKADSELIAHTNADGNRIYLKPIKSHKQQHPSSGRERRDSFVENFSDGFSNFFSSFKRLLNL